MERNFDGLLLEEVHIFFEVGDLFVSKELSRLGVEPVSRIKNSQSEMIWNDDHDVGSALFVLCENRAECIVILLVLVGSICHWFIWIN